MFCLWNNLCSVCMISFRSVKLFTQSAEGSSVPDRLIMNGPRCCMCTARTTNRPHCPPLRMAIEEDPEAAAK